MHDDLDVMDEREPTDIDKAHIEARVRDWTERVAALFRVVREWASSENWRVSDSALVTTHEELAEKAGLPAIQLPTLRLDRSDGAYALFKPKGLWVIGANGRVDLYTSKGLFIIVDRAEYGNDARWTIFRATSTRGGEPFDPTLISQLT